MAGGCSDRIVAITGAGRGIGREEALEFARQGARVVVNDIGSSDGKGDAESPAHAVVEEIRKHGGQAVAYVGDVSDWDNAAGLIRASIDAYGDLDVLVNNAGILRDRMLVNMTPDEWDSVIRVHLRGTFACTQNAATYWRSRAKEGEAVDASVINTSSPSGLYGNVGQANYGAAKAGIAGFTVIAADELARYGVTVNAIAPSALTRMTETLDHYVSRVNEVTEATGFNPGDPANIAPLVAWLGSSEARDVNGRVFNVTGGTISVAETWSAGPEAEKVGRWEFAELGPVLKDLVSRARPNSDGRGHPREG